MWDKKKIGTNEYAFYGGGGGGGGIDLYPSLETKYIIKETAANALSPQPHTIVRISSINGHLHANHCP